MALPWPDLNAPTLRLAPVTPRLRVVTPTAARRPRSAVVSRLRGLAASPITALVVLLAGLALLFALPTVGLPFVALVVLPAVIYHLRAEHRVRLRRPRER